MWSLPEEFPELCNLLQMSIDHRGPGSYLSMQSLATRPPRSEKRRQHRSTLLSELCTNSLATVLEQRERTRVASRVLAEVSAMVVSKHPVAVKPAATRFLPPSRQGSTRVLHRHRAVAHHSNNEQQSYPWTGNTSPWKCCMHQFTGGEHSELLQSTS